MTVLAAEVGFVSAGRGLVDFLTHVFQLEELLPIEVGPDIVELVPGAELSTQYRLQAGDGLVLKVTVPVATPRPDSLTEPVLAGTGLRYVTLHVTDLAGVVARARERGGRIEKEPTDVMGAKLALVRDPDGNLYELAELSS